MVSWHCTCWAIENPTGPPHPALKPGAGTPHLTALGMEPRGVHGPLREGHTVKASGTVGTIGMLEIYRVIFLHIEKWRFDHLKPGNVEESRDFDHQKYEQFLPIKNGGLGTIKPVGSVQRSSQEPLGDQ